MPKKRNGSMILTCMFFISICMAIMLLHWRSEESIQTTMIMRVKMVRAQYACEALMQYGIDLCKERYAFLIGRGQPLMLIFERWPLGAGEYGQGNLEISYAKKFEIKTTIRQEKQPLITLSCLLERQDDFPRNIFTISAWKRHEIKA